MKEARSALTRRQLGTVFLSGLGVLLAGACRKAEALSCDDTTALSNEDIAGRRSLDYAEFTNDPERRCDRCIQFIAPKTGCGGCKVMKGPVHPFGTCKVFAPMS